MKRNSDSWDRVKEEEEREPLCLCEYWDRKGRRRHILQCLCQCEDLDAAADDLVSGRGPSSDRLQNISATIQDRIRIPFPGGALRVELSAFPPIFLVPVYILSTLFMGSYQVVVHVATLGYVLKSSVDAVQSVEVRARPLDPLPFGVPFLFSTHA